MIKERATWEYQKINRMVVYALINKNPFLAGMATWDLCITRVTVSVLFVVVLADNCIQAPVAANMHLIVGSYGVDDVSKAECD